MLDEGKVQGILKKRDKIVKGVLILLGLVFLVQALGLVRIISVEKVWSILGIDKWGVVIFYVLIAVILLVLFINGFSYILFLTLLNIEKAFLKKPGRNIVKIKKTLSFYSTLKCGVCSRGFQDAQKNRRCKATSTT